MVHFSFGGRWMLDKDKKQKLINRIINHQVQGEAYIITTGHIWKSMVLKQFNKVQRGEMSVLDLVNWLEIKGGVKFAQKHQLVRYPVEECLKYIAKISKKNLNLESSQDIRCDHSD